MSDYDDGDGPGKVTFHVGNYGRFDMPASTSTEWVTPGPDTTTYAFSNDQHGIYGPNAGTAYWDISGNPHFDTIELSYDIFDSTLTFSDASYIKDDEWFLSIENLNIVISLSAAEEANLLEDPSLLFDYFDGKVTSAGDNFFEGYDLNDLIHGGPGNDSVYGYYGDDKLWGDAGNDSVDGEWGNDKLYGGDGNDDIGDMYGNDRLYGGPGADTFSFGRRFGKDTIKDFERSLDKIVIDKPLASNRKDIKQAAEKYHGGTILDFGADSKLKLVGIKLNELNKIDFDYGIEWYT